MNDIFKKYDTVQKNNKFKQLLIQKRGYRCECCHNSQWLNNPIPLELHHIDGDHSNLQENNLQLLCPNCHNLTDNHHRNKVVKKNITDEQFIEAITNATSIRQALLNLGLNDGSGNYTRAYAIINKYKISLKQEEQKNVETFCIDCGKPISVNSLRCSECYHKYRQLVERPTREELKQLIRTTPFTTIGKQFNVSDNTIRKWCDKYNLPKRSKDIKKYSNEDWELI